MEQLTGFAPIGAPQESAQFLTQQQQIGDFDLTNAVRELLVRFNCNTDTYDCHPQIAASVGKAPLTQLFLQKEFWTYQLLALQENQNINTIEDRLLIQRFDQPQTWFQYFANNVMNLVEQYNMPYRHGW